jgi:hypothetical protein
MITRCKCEGGNVNAFTVGAPWADIVTTVKTPVNWAGMNHQFANSNFTYPGRSISVAGNGQQYHITRVNSYMPNTTDSGTTPGPITNGLVGWWMLNNASGGTDLSGTGNNGSAQGGLTFGTATDHKGNPNGATSFDGLNGYVQANYSAMLNPSTFSISAWACVTGGAGTFRSIVTSRNYALNSIYQGYMMYASNADTWYTMTGSGSAVQQWNQLQASSVVLNQWTHVVIVFDGTNLTLYLNGNFATTQSFSFAPNTSCPLRIGAGKSETTPTYFFPGSISDVRVYNRALSAAEVKEIYNGQ